ncbi:DUF2786 domain-containing protein [Cedecea neteri]|uniref:Uncharacterized protein n=2 Tax=Cedecea neteri TaxID=158822 RepID=A0A291DYU9_9ENTR|nr:DUF2786 domain-containing protein [Cedecea neteri]ATF92816.1 hypothetical protein CO704_12265 [Cedecea neteri]
MSINRDKYLTKIKKLLRLAKGTSSPEEAANAMAKAQAYMREYNLSAADVEFSGITEADSSGAPSNAQRSPIYMHALIDLICKSFGVECYVTGKYRHSRSLKRFVRFYAPGQRAEVAAYAFDVLSRQMMQARKEYQVKHCKRCKPATRIARGDQFCEGWVYGASQVVKPFAIPPGEKGVIERYAAKLREDRGLKDGVGREAKACRGSDNAISAGFSEGTGAQLHHGVNGQNNQPLAIGRS